MKVKAGLHSFRYLWSFRFWLAGPATLIVSIFIMASMSLWLPKGQADIDHLVFPVILFPLIWASVFFYVVLEKSVQRAGLILALLLVSNGGIVIASIMGKVA